MNVIICSPREGEPIFDDIISVEGYVVSSAGCRVERVELSVDGGKTWLRTRLLDECEAWPQHFWEAQLRLRPGAYQLMARAWESASRCSCAERDAAPPDALNGAVHRIRIKIEEDD